MKPFYSVAVILLSFSKLVQCQSASTSASISATSPSSSSVPSCLQSRSPSDPVPNVINQAITTDDAINKACNVQTQQIDTASSTVYYGLNGAYYFNHSLNINAGTRCQDGFDLILTACVTQQNFWGGWIVSGNTNFSIGNHIYPANPLPQGGAGSPTLSDRTVSRAAQSASGSAISNSGPSQSATGGLSASRGSPSKGSASQPAGGSATSSSGSPVSASGDHSTSVGPLATGSLTASAGVLAWKSGAPSVVPSGQSEALSAPSTAVSTSTSTSGVGPGPSPSSASSGRAVVSSPVIGPTGTRPRSVSSATPLPSGASIVIGTVSSLPVTETFIPVTGPSGVSWTPFDEPSGAPALPPPAPPGSPLSRSSTASEGSNPQPTSAVTSIPLPTGGTIVVATVSSQVISETFVPTTYSQYGSLLTTTTSMSFNLQSSPIPIVIGPGGVAWSPYNLPAGAPTVPPPAGLPSGPTIASPSTPSSSQNPKGSTATAASGSPLASVGSSNPSNGPPSATPATSATPDQPPPATQSQSSGAPLRLVTTTYDAQASSLTAIPPSITANTAIRTSDNNHPLGLYPFVKGGRSCFFCPPGIDNGGLILWGMNLPGIYPPPVPPPFPGITNWPTITIGNGNKPTESEEDKKPSATNDPTKSTPQSTPASSTPTTALSSTTTSSARSSSSCAVSAIVSDCNVICSSASATASCTTTCFSTSVGCSAHGTTITSTAVASACELIQPFSSVQSGDVPDIPSVTGIPSPTVGPPITGGFITGSFSGVQSGTNGAQSGSTVQSSSVGRSTPSLASSTVGKGSSATAGSSAPAGNQTTTQASNTLSSHPSVPAVTAAPTATLDCMADGAPWFSPTSWCDCGPSAKYPTLPPISGQTEPNCAYTTTPSSSLNPISVSAAPTNIPGENGLPGCAYVLYPDGQGCPYANYCDCGGTYVGLLTTSVSGTASLNCDYTLQPTANACPTPTTTIHSSTPPPPPPPTSTPPPPPPALPTTTEPLGGPNDQTICAGSNGDAASDIFSCPNNETLFQIFAPGGTPHSLGKYRNDEGGWPTWQGGGCFCINGNFCCDVNAMVPVQVSQNFWDQIEEGGQGGNAIAFFQHLKGACTRSGQSSATHKRDLDDESLYSNLDIEEGDPGPRLIERNSQSSNRFRSITEKNQRRGQLKATRILVPRVSHSDDWNKYAPSGVRYWNEFQQQDQNAPDKALCNFDASYQFQEGQEGLNAGSIFGAFKALVQSLSIPVNKGTYYSSVVVGKGNIQCDFTNSFGPADGVIVANANDRGVAPNQAPDQWSDIAWYLWRRACLTATPGTTDFSNLGYVFRRSVDNPSTSIIMKEAVNGVTEQFVWFTPDAAQNLDNPFWALLGSPNGNGVQHMLTDHKNGLHGKGVAKIGVYLYPTNQDSGLTTPGHMVLALT